LAGGGRVGVCTIGFEGALDGAYKLMANSAGATTFGGVVGGATPLASLTTDAGGSVSLVGATTTGPQDYQDATVTLSGVYSAVSTFNVAKAAVLAGDTTIGAATVDFGSTVNSSGDGMTTSDLRNLTVNATTATSFNGVVGGNPDGLLGMLTVNTGTLGLNKNINANSTVTINNSGALTGSG